MKCVLDTTVNLKQLVIPGGEKLALSVNGEPMIKHHFKAMSDAGITSVFVLIESESSARSLIAREAMFYGFNPTFLEIDKETIAARKSVMAAEPYMKEAFIYWPVNRVLSSDMVQQLVDQKVNSHQVLSILYTDKKHPQLNKNAIFKVEFNPEDEVRQSSKASSFGYDIGVYKCGLIIFKLIDKVAKERPLSWNRIQTALSRAGRSHVITTKSQTWALIETVDDVVTLEKLLAEQTVSEIEQNPIDKKFLSPAYAKLYPVMARVNVLQQQGAMLWILIMVLASSSLLFGPFYMVFIAGVVAAASVMTYPLVEYISEAQPLTQKLKPVTLSILRIAVLIIFSMACLHAYGMGLWVIVSFITLIGEAVFLVKPVEIPDPKIEQLTSSYAIHGSWLLLACFFVIPLIMLIVFALYSVSITATKAQLLYKASQQD